LANLNISELAKGKCMKAAFNASLNLNDIDKSKLVKGKKGTYLNITCWLDTDNPSKYGDHGMVTQSVSKEEREAGQKGPILGNAKVFMIDDKYMKGNSQSNKVTEIDDMEDDVPWI